MNASPLTLDSIVMRNPEVMATEVDGEIVMMDLDSSEYHGLDLVAAAVWKRLDQPIRVRDLVQALGERYDATPEVIGADVLYFLQELAKKKLLEQRG